MGDHDASFVKFAILFSGRLGLMQRAHAQASLMLQRCPYTDENANRIARIVMKLFDEGLRDETIIATKAAGRM
jgi:hypothetical protein